MSELRLAFVSFFGDFTFMAKTIVAFFLLAGFAMAVAYAEELTGDYQYVFGSNSYPTGSHP
jgi:hypothetical protein